MTARRALASVMFVTSGGLACAGAAATTTATTTTSPVSAARPAIDTLPPNLRWFRASAEMRAIYLETYRAATNALDQRARGRAAGSWAVILDADETVLDNSPYQLSRARIGAGYTADTWAAWVRQRAATGLPGAAAFIAHARELGGRVVIVTNRAADQCDDTRANFTSLAIVVDQMLCAPATGGSDKNPRFMAVQQGTPPSTSGPLEVLLWIGDNIQDFPAGAQSFRTGDESKLSEFGRTYFVLPNPMYGSWEPRR